MAQQDLHVPPSLHPPSNPLANTMDNTSDSPQPLAIDDTETDEEHMADGSSSPQTPPPTRIYTPPPHIAARFYRTSTQARLKKGSAASSRRNSISSNHSRSSHGFGFPGGASAANGAPQSKHIAQHLRRASILADRKARLADRAAHAEQVRLRAALAKAAVRDISLSEERAQAAAQAREKKLEEIAAACAEEVKRAKAVAETMKEKREQNLLRVRQQIQDRLDEAERRREELRRNSAAGRTRSRGQSIPSSRKQLEVMPQVAELKETPSQEPSNDASPASAHSAGSPSRDTPTPALTPDEAACKILHWWRKNHRRRVINDFQQLGLAVDSVRDTSFEEVVELLAQDKVLMATGKVLRLCGIQEGKTSAVKEIVVVRAFLSAFLILGHPTQVLSTKSGQEAVTSGQSLNYTLPRISDRGSADTSAASASAAAGASSLPIGKDDLTNPQLQDLVGKAKDLLICFETILSRLTLTNNYMPPSNLASELVEAYDNFYDAFIAWKARDASALVDVMVMQFVELDTIWQTVKDGTAASVSGTYRESIRQNQLLLMVRIKKLAGAEEGKRKIFEAVSKARSAKAEAHRKTAAANAASNMKPREAEDTTIETAMGSLSGRGGGEGHAKARSSTPSASDSFLSSRHASASSSAPNAVVNDAVIADLLPQGKPLTEASAEAKLRRLRFGPPDEKYSSSPLPENRIVIHELAINREFRVSSTVYKEQQAAWMGPIFYRMRKTMAANSREDQEEHFYYLLTIAEVIRSKLERLTAPGKKMHQFIGELLDTEVAQRQFAMGSFSYQRFFSSIGQLLPKLCAPIRDDEVKELVEDTLQQGDYVDRLQALLSFINVMATDHINFMISVAAPRLLLSATDYETRRFALLVNGNDDDDTAAAADEQRYDSSYARTVASAVNVQEQLPTATAAWRAARNKVVAEVAKRDPEGINHPKSRPKPDQFYAQMVTDLFTQLSPVPLEEMPEMLRLDHARAQKWGALTRRIVTAGAVLLQCKNLLKRDVRLPWKTEAHRVMAVLDKAEKDAAKDHNALNASPVIDGVMSALESGRSMPPATKATLRTYVERTMAASAKAAEARNSPSAGGGDAVPHEPVLRLLLHRLRGYLIARLAEGSSAERARQTNTAGDRLTSLGLVEFVDRVREMVTEISRVSEIDRETHGAFWEAVSTRVEREDVS